MDSNAISNTKLMVSLVLERIRKIGWVLQGKKVEIIWAFQMLENISLIQQMLMHVGGFIQLDETIHMCKATLQNQGPISCEYSTS